MATDDVVPTIDVGPLLDRTAAGVAERRRTGAAIVAACESPGVFHVVGHGIDPWLRRRLEACAREFFALDPSEKELVAMAGAGAAWRGWFPLGDELTSGVPDAKEGIYFGTEHGPDHPRVLDGTPLHGANQFPDRPAELRPLVLRWMASVVQTGHAVLRGIALGLGADEDLFGSWCADPTVLFRIFRYPARPEPVGPDARPSWGVAEHTDYGLLTLLAQDDTGGLEVAVDNRWVPVPPLADAFVCNLGDMLERLSGGRFVATPHRVAAPVVDRISMPLFLDPGWDAVMAPLPGVQRAARRHRAPRWDGEDVDDVVGPYSEYLLSRLTRVFPDLFRHVLGDSGGRSERRG